jgi:transposase
MRTRQKSIAKAMREAGVSQNDIAKRLGMSRETVRDWLGVISNGGTAKANNDCRRKVNAMRPSNQTPDPTPAEIRQACQRIQSTWTDDVRAKRLLGVDMAGFRQLGEWAAPVVAARVLFESER